MDKVKFEKTILVRDKYGVKRKAFPAGSEIEKYVVASILKVDSVVNPDDLPEEVKPFVVRGMEVKVLEQPKAEEAKAEPVEAVAEVAEAPEQEAEAEAADKPKATENKKGKKS